MANYYVKKTTGDDSNDGSSGSPWEFCPGMTGWTGSATLSANDTVYFDSTETWTNLSTTASFITAVGGVTYDGATWGGGTRARFLQNANNNVAACPGMFIIKDDDATYETVVTGFEIDNNGKRMTGVTIGWPTSSQTLSGAIKRVENCYIHENIGSNPELTGNSVKVGTVANYNVQNVEILNNILETNELHSTISIYDNVSGGSHYIDGVLVRGNDVSGGYSNAIHLKNDVRNVDILFNYTHDNLKRGVLVEDSRGVGPTGVNIAYNIIENNQNDGICIASPSYKSVDIFGNIVYGNIGEGLIFLENLSAAIDMKVHNNTFYANTNSAIKINSQANFSLFGMANNILVSLSGSIPFYNYDTGGGPISHTNNTYYRSGGGTVVYDLGSTYTAATITGWEATALGTDPEFANVTNLPDGWTGTYDVDLEPNKDGLSLTEGSNCIDNADNLAEEFRGSINTVTRVAGTYDRGAYEMASEEEVSDINILNFERVPLAGVLRGVLRGV